MTPACPCDFRGRPTPRAARLEAAPRILSGKAGNAWFEVVASLVRTVLEPTAARVIELKHDCKRRRARVVIPGLLEPATEPVRNLATGAPPLGTSPRRGE